MLPRILIEPVEGETIAVVRLEGELDLTNSRDVAETLLRHVSDESPGLVVDLAAVRYIDSAGIRLFVDVSERLHRNRQTLALVVPAEAPIGRTLAIVKMELLVPVRGSVDEAVQAITSPAEE